MEFLQQMPAKASICEELNYHIPRVQTWMLKFYVKHKPGCEQSRMMDSNILKKEHWRIGYLYILKVSLSRLFNSFRENTVSVPWIEKVETFIPKWQS
jgi:hypothetical protein